MADSDETRRALEEFFDMEWDDVLVVIETRCEKTGQSREEVTAELLGRARQKPAVPAKVRKSLIRWIGKPWRERENPWDKFKGRVPGPPPRTDAPPDDLDEWVPLRPDDDN